MCGLFTIITIITVIREVLITASAVAEVISDDLSEGGAVKVIKVQQSCDVSA